MKWYIAWALGHMNELGKWPCMADHTNILTHFFIDHVAKCHSRCGQLPEPDFQGHPQSTPLKEKPTASGPVSSALTLLLSSPPQTSPKPWSRRSLSGKYYALAPSWSNPMVSTVPILYMYLFSQSKQSTTEYSHRQNIFTYTLYSEKMKWDFLKACATGVHSQAPFTMFIECSQSSLPVSHSVTLLPSPTERMHGHWTGLVKANDIIHYTNTLSSLFSRWPPLAILLLKTFSGLGVKAYLHKDHTELQKRHNGLCTGNERQPFHRLHSAQHGTTPQKTASKHRSSPKTRQKCFGGKTDKSFWKLQSQALLVFIICGVLWIVTPWLPDKTFLHY